MFPGPYVTGAVVASPTIPVTTWYNVQTTYPKPATTTITANLTAASLIAARTSYCPISPEDYDRGFSDADLPSPCEDLIGPYCYPDPDKPILTSTRFPANCTPLRPTASSTTVVTNAIPTPLEPSTIPSCKQYYRVLDGDNCYSIATNFDITSTQVSSLNLSFFRALLGPEIVGMRRNLADERFWRRPQFDTWNPFVGSDCQKLYLGYYVCIKAWLVSYDMKRKGNEIQRGRGTWKKNPGKSH